MRSSRIAVAAIVTSVSAMSVVSCVNEAYDLRKPIDLTVKVDGDISVPLIKNSEFITIGALLKDKSLGDNIVLVPFDNSQDPDNPDTKGYYMLKVLGEAPIEGSFGELNLNLNEGLDTPEPLIINHSLGANTEIDFKNIVSADKRAEFEAALAAEGLSGEIDVVGKTPKDIKSTIDKVKSALYKANIPFDESKITYPTITIPVNGTDSNAMPIDIDTDVPSIVKEIGQISLDAAMKFSLGPDFGKVTLEKGFKIDFPTEINVEPAGGKTDSGWEVRDGHTIFFKDDFDVYNNTVLDLKITGINNVEIQSGPTGNRLKLSKKISVEGTAVCDVKKIMDDPAVADEQIQNTVRFKAQISFDTFKLGNVEVKLDLDAAIAEAGGIDDQEIVLGDILPKEISRNDITLDLDNPIIRLSIKNDSPLEASLKAEIDAFDADGNSVLDSPIDLAGKINIKANENATQPAVEQRFAISRKGLGELSDEWNIPAANDIPVPELGTLIQKLPNKIAIRNIGMENNDKDFSVVDFGPYSGPVAKGLGFSCEYEVRAPLAFGNELNIRYALDPIKDLNKTLNPDSNSEDGNNLKINLKELHLDLTIANSLPLALGIEVTPLNLEGKPIGKDEIVVDINFSNRANTNEILSGKAVGNVTEPQNTDVAIVIAPKSIEVLKVLDGLEIIITGNAGDTAGIALSNTHGFQITNAKARITGGVEMDNGTINLFE